MVSGSAPPQAMGFHVMCKPTGPICNLDCRYCYYLEKERLYPTETRWRMSDDELEAFVRNYIASQPGVGEIEFAWQGGEPTLMGRTFFERAVALQRQYRPEGVTIRNALQTNGTLLDDDFAAFLAREDFLVGISIDGPADLHDANRLDKGGKPSHARVLAGVELLRNHGVEFNILCTVNRANSRHPLRVYRYLAGLGAPCIQFIPLVERYADEGNGCGTLARTPELDPGRAGGVTPFSVRPADYGSFLTTIFDHWVRHDVGRVFVQIFDVTLATTCGQPAGLCVFNRSCGRGLVMEHNGDVFACDHYVYDEYKLGNAYQQPIAEMVDAPDQQRFGEAKHAALPRQCCECPVLHHCWGGCPKHRFARDRHGEDGLNHLCPGYHAFFSHARPHMHRMAGYLAAGLPPATIMADLAREERIARKTGPNQPCPCGSGRKHKKCCGRGR